MNQEYETDQDCMDDQAEEDCSGSEASPVASDPEETVEAFEVRMAILQVKWDEEDHEIRRIYGVG